MTLKLLSAIALVLVQADSSWVTNPTICHFVPLHASPKGDTVQLAYVCAPRHFWDTLADPNDHRPWRVRGHPPADTVHKDSTRAGMLRPATQLESAPGSPAPWLQQGRAHGLLTWGQCDPILGGREPRQLRRAPEGAGIAGRSSCPARNNRPDDQAVRSCWRGAEVVFAGAATTCGETNELEAGGPELDLTDVGNVGPFTPHREALMQRSQATAHADTAQVLVSSGVLLRIRYAIVRQKPPYLTESRRKLHRQGPPSQRGSISCAQNALGRVDSGVRHPPTLRSRSSRRRDSVRRVFELPVVR